MESCSDMRWRRPDGDMRDDWVHPPGWAPESKAKAAAEQKEKSFSRKYRFCLIPIVLGAIAGLSVAFLFQDQIRNYI